ncbi:MAG: Fic family protein [Mollicutes bacterium]|nr:Fic family protein [Mollicutes bacterium]MDY5875256.1 Fic family protein [Bacilli bacterium]
MAKEKLPLKTLTGIPFRINIDILKEIEEELEIFLLEEDFMNTRDFSKKVMFNQEIKANNTVEGYNDSVSFIKKVIENASEEQNIEKRNRIINLYNGYQYILKGQDITEENVLKLYKILSKDLLEEYDLSHMGEKYRKAPVYILKSGRLDDSMDEGIPYEKIEEYMDSYFEFIDTFKVDDSQTEEFIKSQIMHFYFVYIHPFFDINGRSSRTIAMWYLLNKEVYPYIIFNRGINFDSNYDRVIGTSITRLDITEFLKYMLISVKKELEKEYIIHNLDSQSERQWHTIDYQALNYFLALNGEKTVLDYATTYNRLNTKKNTKTIFENMLLPMIEDETLKITRTTKKNMFENVPNLVLELNKDKVNEINLEKVKRLKLY